MKQFLKKCLLATVVSLFFYACPKSQKIPQSNEEVAQAIRDNNILSVKLWVANGGDVNRQLINHRSPLYIATGPKGGDEMVKLLLEKGAKVEVGAGKYTPLMNAASWVDLESVQLLLDKGADKTLTNENGQTAYDLIGDCGDCPKAAQVKVLLKTVPIIRYVCEDNTRLTAVIKGEQAKVRLIVKNQTTVEFVAKYVPSASGAKYVGEGYVYWTKGKECLIEKDQILIHRACNEIRNYEGMFSYMADANMFVSCDKSIGMSVEMEGDYLTLERAYSQLVKGGTSVYVRLEGYSKEVSAMEGDGKEIALILTRLVDIAKNKNCP